MISSVPSPVPAAAPVGPPPSAPADSAGGAPFADVFGALVGGTSRRAAGLPQGDSTDDAEDGGAVDSTTDDAAALALVSPVLVAFVNSLATPPVAPSTGAEGGGTAIGTGPSSSVAPSPDELGTGPVVTPGGLEGIGDPPPPSGFALEGFDDRPAPFQPGPLPAPPPGMPIIDLPKPAPGLDKPQPAPIEVAPALPAPPITAPPEQNSPAPSPAPTTGPAPGADAAAPLPSPGREPRHEPERGAMSTPAGDAQSAGAGAVAAPIDAVTAATAVATWRDAARRALSSAARTETATPASSAENLAASSAENMTPAPAIETTTVRAAALSTLSTVGNRAADRLADQLDSTAARDLRRSEPVTAQVLLAVRDASGRIDAGPMSKPAIDAPVSARALDESLSTQIVQSLRVHWGAGASEARVQLRPEYLGELTMAIKVEQGAVVASLRAESPEVRRWIEANASTLRDALADHGLRLDRLVVHGSTETPESEAEGQPDTASSEQEAPSQRRRRRPPTPDATPFEFPS